MNPVPICLLIADIKGSEESLYETQDKTHALIRPGSIYIPRDKRLDRFIFSLINSANNKQYSSIIFKRESAMLAPQTSNTTCKASDLKMEELEAAAVCRPSTKEQGRVANSACARYAHARSGRRRTRNAATATLCEEEIYTCRIRAHDDDGDQANCAEKLAATQPLIVTTQ